MLIQVVPALPPTTSGVGDYALALARVLRQDFALDTEFVVGNAEWQGPDRVEDFRVWKLPARSGGDLEAMLESIRIRTGSSRVLLHLSIYGYAARGCPFWLVEGLRRWKAKQPDSKLVTMFHELYAFGPPWGSAFWVSRLQRTICSRIARLSDTAVTNAYHHRETLERFDPSKRDRIPALAITSNVGEPSLSIGLGKRLKSMVIMGQKPLRKRSYERKKNALLEACQRLGITEIHDVGAVFDEIPDRVGEIPVTRHGFMGANDLSLLLSNSVAGFMDYPGRGYLAKSGVFAAYCAHGVIPVTPGDEGSEADGIGCGVHYYSVEGNQESADLAKMQSIADAAWNWYQGHSLRCHARVFADIILG